LFPAFLVSFLAALATAAAFVRVNAYGESPTSLTEFCSFLILLLHASSVFSECFSRGCLDDSFAFSFFSTCHLGLLGNHIELNCAYEQRHGGGEWAK
jgi:hypothetical protein